MTIALVEIADAHFAWMLGESEAPTPGLVLPPGGIDGPEVLNIVRHMTQQVHRAGSRGSWMIVDANMIVGLCSYKQAPQPDGTVEIGYGVAASCRRRGYATEAVAAMLDFARGDRAVATVTAATAVANIASQRALERNGFVQVGTSHDPDDGDVLLWKRDLP